ncbi:membrane glycosyltransferase [Solimonas aquatica]|uniref:Glucans biosynthesis glucosyltransferase H n=1 Tax=Solimonas aquatica TaxID=489703 RepID=A0A1H9JZL2_9GAMM|nr:glucans biosynthesis glucosyltransferase MdoH [Solimonas aquatica]SEQ92279.1 membrane glycosyltransferase [Solimonas aquatica]
MNQTAPPPARRLADYLQQLPTVLTQGAVADETPASTERFTGLHNRLAAQQEQSAELATLHSCEARLRSSLNPAQPGDVRLDSVLQSGPRARLFTTPPLLRASMAPLPWNNNPIRRLWAWLARRAQGNGHHISPHDGQLPPAPQRKALDQTEVAWGTSASIRRALLVLLIALQTIVATYLMSAVMPYKGHHPLELASLVLYTILFAWISAGFWTAVFGFFVLLFKRDKYAISATAAADAPLKPGRNTAILVPICNEDVARVFAGVRATIESVKRRGLIDHFDFYILSDSGKADARAAEMPAWLELCRAVDGFGRIFYRRRIHRIKKKSGNIADWCRRWGSKYQHMVILDADSVMSGECLQRLVQLMEANPSAGIIQTAPRAAGRETLYSRIQQFATRVYGPLFTAGLHFWQLGESHYWGHNAIIRVAPFMQHCALGRLPGSGGLSGEILSHDFVEAALMRRAGWAVWIAYDLPGSYEEMPPTLLDELKRDQRWCQGNLQNFQLFFTSGLHPAHRAVFMTGVMAYLSAPLWFISLAMSTGLLAVFMLSEPQYFTQPYQLFPTWPEWHPEWAIRLFAGTMSLLFLPKLLSALLLMLRQEDARPYGGRLRLFGSLLMEMLFSALLAPIRMLFHTQYVVSALLGIPVQWKSPPRNDDATPWSQAIVRHGGGSVLGLFWLALVYWLNPSFLWWLLPVAGSLVIAIPLSVWSSRATLGRRMREQRFFLIPEESITPRELRHLKAFLRRAPEYPDFRSSAVQPIANALAALVGRRREKLPARARADLLKAADEAARKDPASLSEAQRNLLLLDALALSRLHERIWTQADTHPAWFKR